MLDVLAAAYAEVGRFQDAIAAAKKAADLVAKAGDAVSTAQIAKRLEKYQMGEPYREPIIPDEYLPPRSRQRASER